MPLPCTALLPVPGLEPGNSEDSGYRAVAGATGVLEMKLEGCGHGYGAMWQEVTPFSKLAPFPGGLVVGIRHSLKAHSFSFSLFSSIFPLFLKIIANEKLQD